MIEAALVALVVLCLLLGALLTVTAQAVRPSAVYRRARERERRRRGAIEQMRRLEQEADRQMLRLLLESQRDGR